MLASKEGNIMSELVNARCVQGRLIITETAIIVRRNILGRVDTKTLPRKVFTSLESKTTVPSVFGKGGAATLIFHGMGAEAMKVTSVPLKDAQKIEDILNGIV
jgi:hypothetical protein